MSFKQVTELRKSGDIAKALEVARSDYDMSVNHYSASALFWTLKVACDEDMSKGDMQEARSLLNEMQDVFEHINDREGIAQRSLEHLQIRLDPESSCIYDSYTKAKNGDAVNGYSRICEVKEFSLLPEKIKEYAAWVVFYYLKAHIGAISIKEFDEAIDVYYLTQCQKPSLVHSQILNMAIKFTGIHQDYNLLEFIKRWDIRNFRPEDCERNPEFANGLSLRDRAVRRCFINRKINVDEVEDIFKGSIGLSEGEVSELLSRSYSYLLYQDSVELKDRGKFFADAHEYVSRISHASPTRNQYHSRILQSVIWEMEDTDAGWFKDYFETWGFGDSLLETDWHKQESRGGVKLPSLAERALSKYSEALSRNQIEDYSEQYKLLLNLASTKIADNEGILRRLAKIHYKEGDVGKALAITVDLIKTHTGKFYFWSDLASYLASSEEKLIMACYAKSILSCNDEKYLGKIHLNLGRILQKKRMFREALYEADKYRSTYEQNGWPIKREYEELMGLIPIGTKPAEGNAGLYIKLERPADDFVYADLPKHTMMYYGKITRENKTSGKKRLMFVLFDRNNDRFLINPNAFGISKKTEIRSCFEVRYIMEGVKKKVVSVQPAAQTEVLHYQTAVVVKTADNKIDSVIGHGFKARVQSDFMKVTGRIGDCVEVALNKRAVKGKVIYSCIDLRASDKQSDLVSDFHGHIRIIQSESKTFGFVNDIYVGKHLLNGFSNNDKVSGIAVTEAGRTFALRIEHII